MQVGRPYYRGVGIGYKQTEQILYIGYTKYSSMIETFNQTLNLL